jgi:hypothetical protein
MKFKIAFLAFGLTSFLAIADETNWVTAAPQFREVNGELYNTEKSIKFQLFEGKIETVLTNAIVLQKEWTSYDLDGSPRWNFGDKIFITNFPASLDPTTGSIKGGRAMRVGTINFEGDVLQLWDYGTPHRVMVVTTNKTDKISN